MVSVRLPLLAVCIVSVLGVVVAARSESVSQEEAAFSWRFATGGQIRSRPAIAADGTVYAMAEDSFLYAVSPVGHLEWKCDLGWLPWDCLSVGADGTIYAGLKNRELVAVSPHGSVVWRSRFDGPFVADPLAAPDGTLYVGIAPGTLVALSHLGRQLWSITLPASFAAAPVMDGAGTIYLAASDRRLYALTQWGEFKWSLPLHDQPTASAIAGDATVAVGTEGGAVIVVTPDGDVAWHRAIGGAPVAGISAGTDQLVAAASSGIVVGLSGKGRELWRADVRGKLDSPPFLGGPGVRVLSQDGTMVDLHPPRGLEERFSIGTPGGAVMGGDGTLYLGGRDWVLYAFPRPDGAPHLSAPWPQAGHDERHSGRTPSAPRDGIDSLLNANPDYLYLHTLADSGSREQTFMFLSEVRSRIVAGSAGKSTWYVVRLLEQIAGTGLITPVYQNQKVINDYPDVRAAAASMLGTIGSASSRWTLVRVVRAESDSFALSQEIQALGALASDPDGASARAIAAGFSRAGTSPADNRLAAAVVAALDSIAAYNGRMSDPSSSETLFSIYRGDFFEDIRDAAMEALQRDRGSSEVR